MRPDQTCTHTSCRRGRSRDGVAGGARDFRWLHSSIYESIQAEVEHILSSRLQQGSSLHCVLVLPLLNARASACSNALESWTSDFENSGRARFVDALIEKCQTCPRSHIRPVAWHSTPDLRTHREVMLVSTRLYQDEVEDSHLSGLLRLVGGRRRRTAICECQKK